MSIIQAIVLGLIQGLTEFLPISSSAHLLIIPKILGWEDQSITFDVFLHFATLLAVLVYFRKEISEIGKGIISSDSLERGKSVRLITLILICSLPVIPFYILIKGYLDQIQSFSLVTILALIILGIPMLFIEKIYHKNKKEGTDLNWRQALVIGVAQSLALISGVSRSGITIMVGLVLGLERTAARRFSFLIAIPVIGGGFLLELLKVSNLPSSENWLALSVGMLTAFASGYLAINILMRIMNKNSLAIFGIYRIILALILLTLFWNSL